MTIQNPCMPPSTRESFTLSAGLAIQSADLARWRKVLNDEAYNALNQECARRNADLPTNALGWAVWRGQAVDEFVHAMCDQPKKSP